MSKIVLKTDRRIEYPKRNSFSSIRLDSPKAKNYGFYFPRGSKPNTPSDPDVDEPGNKPIEPETPEIPPTNIFHSIELSASELSDLNKLDLLNVHKRTITSAYRTDTGDKKYTYWNTGDQTNTNFTNSLNKVFKKVKDENDKVFITSLLYADMGMDAIRTDHYVCHCAQTFYSLDNINYKPVNLFDMNGDKYPIWMSGLFISYASPVFTHDGVSNIPWLFNSDIKFKTTDFINWYTNNGLVPPEFVK